MIAYLRKLSAKELFICVFFLLLILNYNCLCNPPYWDDIVGLHNQAIWLAHNDFNYIKLNDPGQQYYYGGSNVYPYGIIPVIYGILYKLFAPATVHFIGHVFNIACLSAACAMAYNIMRHYTRDNLSATLWAFACLAEPVMAGRSAALGQECPLIAFMMLIVYMMSRHRILSAAILCFFVILFKLTGIILGLALVVWVILYCLITISFKSNFHIKNSLAVSTLLAVISSILGLILLACSNQVSDDTFVLANITGFLHKVYDQFTIYLPIQALYLFCAIILIGINIYIFVCVRRKKLLLRRYSFCIYLLIFICGFYMAFFVVSQLPRYTGCVVFPLVIFICLLSYKIKISRALALFFLVIGLVSMHGKFYSAIPPHLARSGECLERSREYLIDLRLNQELCLLLEKNSQTNPVVAKWPYVQMFTVPEFGYVDKSLQQVYSACIVPKYTSARGIPKSGTFPPQTLFLYSPVIYEYWINFGVPMFPEKNDKIIYLQHKLGGDLILYKRSDYKSSIYGKNIVVSE